MKAPQYTTNAINIKTYPLGEEDNILLAYSKEKGLIKCIARGTKKIKSKLGARAQALISNKLLLNKGKNFDKIAQAETINSFLGIRKDFDKLNYALYIGDTISSFCKNTEDESSEQIYDILYRSLENISKSKDKKEIILSVLKFQIQLTNILGWGIDFENCTKCGCKITEDSYYSKSERIILCKNCTKESPGELIKIHKKIKKFMSDIGEYKIDEKTEYDDIVNLKTVEICFDFMKKHLDSLSLKKQKFINFSEYYALNK